MPCNRPMVNERVTITTKFPLTDKDALMMALHDLEEIDRTFFYEVTATGEIKVRSSQGEATLQWTGSRYEVKADNTAQGNRVIQPVVSHYQAVVIQNTYIEAGFMTEKIETGNNVVQVNAWRI